MSPSVLARESLKPLLSNQLRNRIAELRGGRRKLRDVAAVAASAAEHIDELCPFAVDPRTQRIQELRYIDLGNYRKGALGGWGVEIRDPAGDRRLVELCLSIPPEHFLAGGLPRGLARQAFADRLPAIVAQERRYGYQAANWHQPLKDAQPELIDEVARIRGAAGAAEVIDLDKLKRLAATLPDTGWDDQNTIGQYRLSLLRGVSAGHFYRKAKGSNA